MNSSVTTGIRDEMKRLSVCVIVPTYNNQTTVLHVLNRLRVFASDIVVVNDGSTDNTLSMLTGYVQMLKSNDTKTMLTLISYSENQGKGNALRCGFLRAQELGFRYAVTIDSDGQHYPEDIPLFVECLKECISKKQERVLLIGNRNLQQENMPEGNTFANHFSNFWFSLQTWQRLPDTQSGFRLYSLEHLHGLQLITARYEAELELLVLAAWHGVSLQSVPIRVYYPPRDERTTHFRPFRDFFRISLLNTCLCILCFVYGWWAMLWHKLF